LAAELAATKTEFMIGWWFFFLLTLKERKNLIHDKIAIKVENQTQILAVLLQNLH
jgi:hypothetical protein